MEGTLGLERLTGAQLFKLGMNLPVGGKCTVVYDSVKTAIIATNGAVNKRAMEGIGNDKLKFKRWSREAEFPGKFFVTVEKVDTVAVAPVQTVCDIITDEQYQSVVGETLEERIERLKREDSENES